MFVWWRSMTVTMSTTAPPDSPVLGHEIARLRKELEPPLTQIELAVKSGVGITTVQRAEKSNPGVEYRNIVKIAKALGVSTNAIYLPDVEQTPAPTTAAWEQFAEQVTTALADIAKQNDRIEKMLRDLTVTKKAAKK
jgi:transcriptional regulator with XRE-family HTH domain